MNPTKLYPDYPEGPEASLDALLAALEGNKYDRAVLGISLCIEHGIDTGPGIIAALKSRGFNSKYIGLLLHELSGTDPAQHFWLRHESGAYSCHPDSA